MPLKQQAAVVPVVSVSVVPKTAWPQRETSVNQIKPSIQPEPQPSSRGVPWASKIHKSQAKIMKLHQKLSPASMGTSFVQF